MELREQLIRDIVQFTDTPAYSFLIEDLNEKVVNKLKIKLDKEGLNEVYYVLQGIAQITKTIQSYKNELVTSDEYL